MTSFSYLHRSVLVPDGKGGVILVGGQTQDTRFLDTLYHLSVVNSDSKAAAAAELEAVRAARNAERDAKRAAAAEAERLRLEDEAITQEARDLDLRARQKEARDLRYVARKQKRK